MLSGVCVGTNDLENAGAFYDNILATIGMSRVVVTPEEIGYAAADGVVTFFVVKPYDKKPASFGNGTQVMFYAPDQDAVQKFHEAAIKNGGSDEGAPGPRDYSEGYFGAYVRDIDGNKLHVAIRPVRRRSIAHVTRCAVLYSGSSHKRLLKTSWITSTAVITSGSSM